MRGFKTAFYRPVLTVVWVLLAFKALPAFSQTTLYDNGPDGNIGYYHANFGAAVSNSFVLPQAATLTDIVLTLYDVDDRNRPENLKWQITTEPFGGTVVGSGFASTYELAQPYLTKFMYFAWKTGFSIPNLGLPAGTYYLQIQDIVTRWDTWAFWAETVNGPSQGYYEAIGPNGAGRVSAIPSEAFTLMGQWRTESTEP